MKALLFLTLLSIPLFGDPFSYFPSMKVEYHPITTNDQKAVEEFSNGLMGIYAFNYDRAYASFEKASQLDPKCAMAYWGMALSLDQNLTRYAAPQIVGKTYALVQKAKELAKGATQNEQAYIEALSKRFSDDPKADKIVLRKHYRDAMAKVNADYPEDLDAATLYAESRMDAMNWQLWDEKGEPVSDETLGIVTLLESVLKRDPTHAGANHYNIHAQEFSNHPQRALISAYMLDGAFPQWGHLLHTPAHIYMRVGSYEMAAESDKRGVEADRKYIEQYGLEGRYPVHYLCHNLFYLTRAYLWQEREKDSKASALEMATFMRDHIPSMPGMEFSMLAPLQVSLYFHRFDEILKTPEPAKNFPLTTVFWRFCRARAFLALGSVEEAKKEQAIFLKLKESYPDDMINVAALLLDASFAEANGDEKECEKLLKQAVAIQDKNGESSWFYPLRQTLGAHYLSSNNPKEAEKIFYEALDTFPRNGRSLFGLSLALKAQGKESYWIERECKEALRYSDTPLSLQSY